jgi:hypothetical protein
MLCSFWSTSSAAFVAVQVSSIRNARSTGAGPICRSFYRQGGWALVANRVLDNNNALNLACHVDFDTTYSMNVYSGSDNESLSLANAECGRWAPVQPTPVVEPEADPPSE